MTIGGAHPVVGPGRLTAICLALVLTAIAAASAHAQMLAPSTTTASDFGARKVFLMLFLMLGPIKILVPFVDMTRGADLTFRRTLARRAILFSAAALALAGVLGRTMLENLAISLPVLALTGGVVLFLVALANRASAICRHAHLHEPGRSAARPEIGLCSARVPDDRHALRDRRGDCLCNPGRGAGGCGVHGGRQSCCSFWQWIGWRCCLPKRSSEANRPRPSGVCRRSRGYPIALGLQVILHSLCLIGVRAVCAS